MEEGQAGRVEEAETVSDSGRDRHVDREMGTDTDTITVEKGRHRGKESVWWDSDRDRGTFSMTETGIDRLRDSDRDWDS